MLDQAFVACPAKSPSNLSVRFRLPSGSVHVWRFLPTEPVRELYNFVYSILPQSEVSFVLSRTHPRQDLTAPDVAIGTIGLDEMETLIILGI